MTDKDRYIAACGVPDMLIAACNALGLYLPVKKVEESRLENTRPDGWIISAGIFACHLDFLLPYRKHVLIYFDTRVHSNELSSPRLISIYDNGLTPSAYCNKPVLHLAAVPHPHLFHNEKKMYCVSLPKDLQQKRLPTD